MPPISWREAITAADVEGEVREQRLRSALGVPLGEYRRQWHERKPEAQFGDMARPLHHVHTVEVFTGNRLLAVKTQLSSCPSWQSRSFPQIIEDVQHSDQK